MLLQWSTYSGYLQIFIYLIFISFGMFIQRLSQTFPNVPLSCNIRFDEHNNSLVKMINQTKSGNLIISSGINVPLQKLYRFIRSARSSCNDCYIIIFIDNSNKDDLEKLIVLYNVTFLSYDNHVPSNMDRSRIVSTRFVIYYNYLKEHQYDNIFICDLTDVLFQKNIFNNMEKNIELYGFLESVELTIGGCALHREWLVTCYNSDVLNILFDKSRSCAGTTLGTYKGIMRYLSLMNDKIRSKFHCNDQGIHNYLLYLVLNTTSTALIPHETGFVGSIGTSPWVYRNIFGLVLNKKREVYSVIHQFYHSEQLKQQLNREYELLSNDILDKKS